MLNKQSRDRNFTVLIVTVVIGWVAAILGIIIKFYYNHGIRAVKNRNENRDNLPVRVQVARE